MPFHARGVAITRTQLAGFGPVHPNGFGVGYCIDDGSSRCVVSSFRWRIATCVVSLESNSLLIFRQGDLHSHIEQMLYRICKAADKARL